MKNSAWGQTDGHCLKHHCMNKSCRLFYAAASVAAAAAAAVAAAVLVLRCFGEGNQRPNAVANLVSEFVHQLTQIYAGLPPRLLHLMHVSIARVFTFQPRLSFAFVQSDKESFLWRWRLG